MPRRLTLAPSLDWLLAEQDGVITTRQAREAGHTRGSLQHLRDSGRWQRLLPGVLVTHGQAPTRRQRVFAAALWAGPQAAIDGISACPWHRIELLHPDPDVVHVVVPHTSSLRSTGFVRVRRSSFIVLGPGSSLVRYVDAATAAVVAARSMTSERAIAALLGRTLQRGVVTEDDLLAAHVHASPRGAGPVTAVLEQLLVGIRSAGELDAARLIGTSRILPPPSWNVWLRLADGGPLISPDALIEDAAMVVEVNGKRYHAWGLAFEATEARQLRLEAAGLTVAPLTPRRMAVAGPQALTELEAVYRRLAGRGMPPGVEIVRRPGEAAA